MGPSVAPNEEDTNRDQLKNVQKVPPVIALPLLAEMAGCKAARTSAGPAPLSCLATSRAIFCANRVH